MSTGNPYEDVENAVWGVLNERGWFGKHVEDEEMDALGRDLEAAIYDALNTWVS